MAAHKVFYSWQSDLTPNKTRYFIQDAIQEAINNIQKDADVTDGWLLDRDTKDVPGTPNIVATILDKIDNAQAFVADVSIIGRVPSREENGEERPTPNPNVLLELGYAFKALGESNVILVMDTDFGSIKDLPFDLTQRRITPYSLQTGSRAENVKKLAAVIEERLRNSFTLPSKSKKLTDQIQTAIVNRAANADSLIDDYMKEVAQELAIIVGQYPDITNSPQSLVDAIDQTKKLVVEFAEVADAVASHNQTRLAQHMFLGFGYILQNYHFYKTFNGQYRCQRDLNDDFYKFMGYELFVTLVARLSTRNRWEILADILSQPIYVSNADNNRGAQVSYTHIAQPVLQLGQYFSSLNASKTSPVGEIIKQRHSQGEIAAHVSLEQFTEADYLLGLRSVPGVQITTSLECWASWCVAYLEAVPRFLALTEQKSIVADIMNVLAVTDIQEFQATFQTRNTNVISYALGSNGWGIEGAYSFDPSRIAT